MSNVIPAKEIQTDKRYAFALWLALATIIYNILEGVISVYFGLEDESLALFGFGVDSFIEVISGTGIAHMIVRIQNHKHENRDKFEKTALRITGLSFYLLVAGLLFTSAYNIWVGHQPETTLAGVIISTISILVMWALIYGKMRVGKQLNSQAILADAACTKICVYMSIVLLISSGVYELTHYPYIDSIGALLLAYFSFKEGRECFEKAAHDKHCACDGD